jgi:hypothetical protein
VLQLSWQCIGAELQQLLGLDLGAIVRFLSLAVSSSGRLQGELSFLVMRLCANCPAALRAICSLKCTVVVTDSAGAPKDQLFSGLELVKRLLHNGTELSRACACGLLGELALYSEAPEEDLSAVHRSTAETTAEDSDDAAIPAEQRHLIRVNLVNDGTVNIMLEVLNEVTTALVRSSGVKEAPEAATANPRQKSSSKAAAAVRFAFVYGVRSDCLHQCWMRLVSVSGGIPAPGQVAASLAMQWPHQNSTEAEQQQGNDQSTFAGSNTRSIKEAGTQA